MDALGGNDPFIMEPEITLPSLRPLRTLGDLCVENLGYSSTIRASMTSGSSGMRRSEKPRCRTNASIGVFPIRSITDRVCIAIEVFSAIRMNSHKL